MKNKPDITRIKELLEKYYDGDTSAGEEKKLKDLLLHKNLPECFYPDRELINYFDKQKNSKKRQFPTLAKFSSVAAILLVALLCINLLTTQNESYAYINGEKTTDGELIKTEVLTSINLVTSQNEFEETLQQLNDEELIFQQLSVFNDF